MKRYHDQITETGELKDINDRLARMGKVAKKPTDWVRPVFSCLLVEKLTG